MKRIFTILVLTLLCVLPAAMLQAQTYSAWSQNLSNPAVPYDTSYTYGDTIRLQIPATATYAYGNATLTVYFEGDFGDVSEVLALYMEDNVLYGQAGPYANNIDCSAEDSTVLTIPVSNLSAVLADGMISLRLMPSPNVDYFCTVVRAKARLQYQYCVNGQPTNIPQITIATSAGTVCPGSSPVLLNGNPAGGVFSGLGVNGTTFLADGLNPDNYQVTYTYTDAMGCSFSASTTVIVPPYPQLQNDTICAGEFTTLNSNSPNTYWFSDAGLTNMIGVGASYSTVPLTTTTTYHAALGCSKYGFTLTNATANNAAITDHDMYSGDDRGGIAITNDHIFYTGDNYTVRYRLDLTGGISLPRNDGIFSDLESGKLWTFVDTATGAFNPGTYNAVAALDSNLNFTGEIIHLSTSVFAASGGVFAGKGFVILFSASNNTFNLISLCSGQVTSLGQPTSNYSPSYSENWAYWGIAEFDGTDYSVVYASGSQLLRYNIILGSVAVAAQFNSLSDMAAITYSEYTNRWYFHYEGGSQFGGVSETLGYADATDTTFSAGYIIEGCVQSATVVVDACTGNEEIVAVKNNFIVMPNPNNGAFALQFVVENEQPVTVIITDIQGREVYRKFVVASHNLRHDISVPELAAGTYFVHADFGTTRQQERILITK